MSFQPGAQLYTASFGIRAENVEVPHIDSRPPTVYEVNYPIGKLWVDSAASAIYVLTNITASQGALSATWRSGGGGSGTFTDLTVTGTALFQGPFSVDNANNTITLNSGTGAISIGTDAVGPTTINIGTGGASGVKNTSLGSPNGASSTTIQSGTGSFIIQSQGGVVTLQSGTGTINISNDSTNTTVRLATGSGVKAVTVGSTDTTSSTTIQAGSGALNIQSTNGTLSITAGTGAINIANDATNNTVRLGTGAGQKQVIIGSTNSGSSTNITAGTGGILYTAGQSVSSVGIAAADSPYTITAAYEFIYVNTAGDVTVNLPASPRPGHHIVVADATGDAGTHNITVSGNGNNIAVAGGSSASSKVVNTAFGQLEAYWNGTLWNAVIV